MNTSNHTMRFCKDEPETNIQPVVIKANLWQPPAMICHLDTGHCQCGQSDCCFSYVGTRTFQKALDLMLELVHVTACKLQLNNNLSTRKSLGPDDLTSFY